MPRALVWAFRPIIELKGETGSYTSSEGLPLGWVECEAELAKKLLEEGRVQDPTVGALMLKEIESAPAGEPSKADAQEYQTTQLPREARHTTDLKPPQGRKPRGR